MIDPKAGAHRLGVEIINIMRVLEGGAANNIGGWRCFLELVLNRSYLVCVANFCMLIII